MSKNLYCPKCKIEYWGKSDNAICGSCKYKFTMEDKTEFSVSYFNSWTPRVVINKKNKLNLMLEICMNKKGSIEHINNLPKGYGYYIKKI